MGEQLFRGQLLTDPLPIGGPYYPSVEWWVDREFRRQPAPVRPVRREERLYYRRRPPWPSCLSLDGSAFVVVGALPSTIPAILAAPTAWSIACWAKAGQPESPTGNATANMTMLSANGGWSLLQSDFGGPPASITAQGTASTTVSTSGTVYDFNWHHYALTYDGSSALALYIDGILVNTLSATGTAATATTFTIGGQWGSAGLSNPWRGQLSDVRVWSIPLTAANVAGVYNGGRGLQSGDPVPASLIGWWPLNQTSFADQSGQANPGTLIGSARTVRTVW